MPTRGLRTLQIAIIFACHLAGWLATAGGQDFTSEEKAWLATKPILRVGVDPHWPPFSTIDKRGLMTGIDRDILDLITQETGIEFEIVTGNSWAEVEQFAREGKVDVLCGTAQTPRREKFARFTRVYLPGTTAIITRKDAPFLTSLLHLEGKTVAAPRDHVATLAIASESPGIHLMLTNNFAQALRKVDAGEADATFGNLMSANHTIMSESLNSLKISGVTDHQFDIRYAVVAEGPALAVLDKAIAAFPRRRVAEIIDRWTGTEFQRSISSRRALKVLLCTAGIAGAFLFLIMAWNRSLSLELAERRKMERALSDANDALTAAGVEKSALMQMLAHDLNGSLTVFMMLRDTFERHKNGDPHASGELRMMEMAVDKMTRLIRGLLTADAIESGRHKLELHDVNPAPIVRDVVARLRELAVAKEIDLTFQEVQSPTVHADDLALDQSIENLISNAIKFTPRGGRVEVTMHCGAGGTEIHVADTGPGVSEEDQPLLFKKFSRLTARPTGGESSHGLGLMLVKRLVEAMEGSVRYERRQTVGSVFVVGLKS